MWVEAKEGLIFLKERPGLVGLMIYFGIANFCLGFFNVLIHPLILSLSDEKVLGTVISISGLGMFIGGLIMSAWGGTKNKVRGLFVLSIPMGGSLILVSLTENLIVITIGITLALFLIPITNAHSQSIWQQKVDPKMQGRVFSLRLMVARILMPIAIVSAGPTADYIANPLMEENGALATTLGTLIGVGEGRGVGLVFLIIGLIQLISVVVIYFHPRVRYMDQEIPEAITEEKTPEKVAIT